MEVPKNFNVVYLMLISNLLKLVIEITSNQRYVLVGLFRLRSQFRNLTLQILSEVPKIKYFLSIFSTLLRSKVLKLGLKSNQTNKKKCHKLSD